VRVDCYNIPKDKELTCIIPLRISKDRLDAIERLSYFLMDNEMPSSVGFLVVDDGSEVEEANKIKKKCKELNLGLLRVESGFREFSVGRCRNLGAMYAESNYILMQDVDLMPWPGFYSSLFDEIKIQGLDQDAKKFLMVPYVFLTSEATKEFLQHNSTFTAKKFLHYAWLNNDVYIEKISTGTSANLYNRLWYLSRGGNSSDFEGWGYEDLECNSRMIRHLNFFPLPVNWRLQKYNFNTVLKYESWKSVYRLFGDMLFSKGVAFFHAWHPVSSGGTYMQRGEFNRVLFEKKMKNFVLNSLDPDALPDVSRGRTLIIKKNAFTYARQVQPLLGQIVEPSEELLNGVESVKGFVERHSIDRIIFHNPFLDENVLRIYKEAKLLKYEFVICERGALPGSSFFDNSGFLVDGKTYDYENWDLDLNDENKEKTITYIRTLHNSSDALEDQPARVGADHIRLKLKIKRNKKVLFVPFQRPGDTVTRYFLGQLGEYDNFINLVEKISNCLPSDWVLVAKTHPLEDVDFELHENVIYANSAHVKDLLDISDCMLTFNSGVGVLGMAWGIPTMLAGKAFYYHPEINAEVSSLDDVLKFMSSPMTPDINKVFRFYNYLIGSVYSFGDFAEKKVKLPDGSRMTATTDIEYKELRWVNNESFRFSKNLKPEVSWESFYFDRYRFAQQNEPVASSIINNTAGKKINYDYAAVNVKDSQSMRRLKKFFRSPMRYMADSKHGLLRAISRAL
jgi:predicted glycosyltransferase involved in capsule biosynthesis